MKINFKHVATAALAVAMSLSLAVPAFAAGNGDDKTLTVTGETLDNKKVYAVQMFTARVSGSAGDHTFDSYELAEGWMPFFQDGTDGIGKLAINVKLQNDGDPDNNSLVLGDTPTNEQWENAILAYVQAQAENGADLISLADKAQAWVRSHDGQPSETESAEFANKIITATADNDTAQFTGLKPGYYLVYPEGGGTGNNIEDTSRGTDAMLVNVPRDEDEGDATLNIKSTYPTVEKKVDDGNTATGEGNADNGSAQVGEVVTFTLTSAVPDMNDYGTFVFQFTDKLPAGLTLVDYEEETVENSFSINDVTLKVNNQDVATNKFTVQAVAITEEYYRDHHDEGITAGDIGKTLLTVTITDLKDANLLATSQAATAGQSIVLTYKAMVNENAVVGNDPVTNEAKVEYSNDPDSNSMGSSTPDTSTVYTYDINVHKYANGEEGTLLANAVFALSKNGNLGTLSMGTGAGANKVVNAQGDSVEGDLIALEDNGDPANGTSYVVKQNPSEALEENTYTFTTNATSAIKVQGLEVGTYYLYEVTAPASYNKLKKPVKIEITLEGGDYTKPVYKVTINGVPTTGAVNGSTINVENKKGVTLPETGSIGTIGLTVAGVAIVLIGVFAPRKKKKSNQE